MFVIILVSIFSGSILVRLYCREDTTLKYHMYIYIYICMYTQVVCCIQDMDSG